MGLKIKMHEAPRNDEILGLLSEKGFTVDQEASDREDRLVAYKQYKVHGYCVGDVTLVVKYDAYVNRSLFMNVLSNSYANIRLKRSDSIFETSIVDNRDMVNLEEARRCIGNAERAVNMYISALETIYEA